MFTSWNSHKSTSPESLSTSLFKLNHCSNLCFSLETGSETAVGNWHSKFLLELVYILFHQGPSLVAQYLIVGTFWTSWLRNIYSYAPFMVDCFFPCKHQLAKIASSNHLGLKPIIFMVGWFFPRRLRNHIIWFSQQLSLWLVYFLLQILACRGLRNIILHAAVFMVEWFFPTHASACLRLHHQT